MFSLIVNGLCQEMVCGRRGAEETDASSIAGGDYNKIVRGAEDRGECERSREKRRRECGGHSGEGRGCSPADKRDSEGMRKNSTCK